MARHRRANAQHAAEGMLHAPIADMKPYIKLGVILLLLSFTAASAPAAQTPRTKQMMRAKLDHSQKILEAVVTSNWPLLDRESREMALIVRDTAWSSLMMPDYLRYSDAFLRATNDLTESAKTRDLESASLGLISLTTSCVGCHRYVARSRIVSTAP